MSRIILLGLVILFCLNFSCFGQTSDTLKTVETPKQFYLVFGKKHHSKRFRFYQGNTITLKLTGSKEYYTGEITAIRQDAIVFWQTDIKLRDIKKLLITNETRSQKVTGAVSAIFRKGGILFLLVGAGNYVLVPAARSDGAKTMAGAMALYLTGQALRTLQRRDYKVNSRWQLKTLETIY